MSIPPKYFDVLCDGLILIHCHDEKKVIEFLYGENISLFADGGIVLIKILVVDDEKATREVIVNLINWENLGIEWIGEAENGIAALSVAFAEKPDILLTDIKMPKMDGIELAEKIRQFLPNCKIIFLSGYSDKEYLKAAIRYKAVSYVEKPIELDVITEVLKAAVDQCHTEREHHQKLLTAETNTLCTDLISSKPDCVSINERIKALYPGFMNSDNFISAVIHFHIIEVDSQANHDIFRNECLDQLKFCLTQFDGSYLLGFKGSEYIIIHFSLQNLDEETILNTLQKYLDNIRIRELQIHVSAAVGSLGMGLNGISDSYKTAVIALQQRFYKGIKNILLYYNNTCPPFVFDEAWLKQISEALIKGSLNDTVIIIKRLTNKIRRNENTQPDYIRNIYFRIVMLLSIHAKERNIQLLNDECSFILDSIANSLTIDEIENETLSLVNSVLAYLDPNPNADDVLYKVTNYIHNNYSNPELSINAIAQDIYLTVSYLCVLFKKGTGKTINQYITEYRIEKAKQLLSNKSVKILDVSKLVGYSDAKYFSRVFEKTTGLKPKKYRELHYET